MLTLECNLIFDSTSLFRLSADVYEVEMCCQSVLLQPMAPLHAEEELFHKSGSTAQFRLQGFRSELFLILRHHLLDHLLH